MNKNKKISLLFLLFFPFLIISCNDTKNISDTKKSDVLWKKIKNENTKVKIMNKEQKMEFVDLRDNKKYKLVKIWDQIWMGQNFAYKPKEWKYWSVNNDEKNTKEYWYLYDWETAQKIVPEGWHMPSKEEFNILIKSLWWAQKAYNSLVEKWSSHWGKDNKATNDSLFTALPSWYFDQRDGRYDWFWMLTMFHSSSKYPNNDKSIIGLLLNKNFKKAWIEWRPIELALPVRLIKNN